MSTSPITDKLNAIKAELAKKQKQAATGEIIKKDQPAPAAPEVKSDKPEKPKPFKVPADMEPKSNE